jgi:hypothetical protein
MTDAFSDPVKAVITIQADTSGIETAEARILRF